MANENSILSLLAKVNEGTLNPKNVFLTPQQVTELGNGTPTVNTQAAWRSAGIMKLPYIKVGRKIRYRLSDVLAWFDSQTCGGNQDA